MVRFAKGTRIATRWYELLSRRSRCQYRCRPPRTFFRQRELELAVGHDFAVCARVAAQAAVDGVDAGSAIETVVAIAAQYAVVVGTIVERVVARPAVQRVVARSPDQAVVV